MLRLGLCKEVSVTNVPRVWLRRHMLYVRGSVESDVGSLNTLGRYDDGTSETDAGVYLLALAVASSVGNSFMTCF